MKLYPPPALQLTEFDKIKDLLLSNCQSEVGKQLAENMRIHTKIEFITPLLQKSHEYHLLLLHGLSFPAAVVNLGKELKLLAVPGSVLEGSQFIGVKKLALAMQQIFRWFDNDRRQAYPFLASIITDSWYEKKIIALIDNVFDEEERVKDTASTELSNVRNALYRKRSELRRVFNRISSRLHKLGYLSDIEESFVNGRRVLAVFAEHKRVVGGLIHGSSDTGRTAFIEPEETIQLNNDVYDLENAERKEIRRILLELTSDMRQHSLVLNSYHDILGEYDFTRAKAQLALRYRGCMPAISEKAGVNLVDACHPLLFIYNEKQGKDTVPVNCCLNESSRILVISGPNAGGKTVTLKTCALLQIMLQSGLLVSCSPQSEFGIFKQLMIHIGDTQSLEFELSTYSSHLMHMKHFIEYANGKTLFFIDELGSGSDPSLGGAFAEVIMEELAGKHCFGIVTTHYLNLKVMANKVPGIINGAMAFDEQNLQPLYRLVTGKPGSSYTFSIAERIGMSDALITRAKQLVDENHFKLDNLLNKAEQDLQKIKDESEHLSTLLEENEKMKKEMGILIKKERHRQQVEILRHQNKISEEKFVYLKEMERKLKSILIEWRKAEDKEKVMKMMASTLFRQKEKQVAAKKQKKFDARYVETTQSPVEGDQVKMKPNHQVGVVTGIRGKKAIVQVGAIPITIDISELVVVKDKTGS